MNEKRTNIEIIAPTIEEAVDEGLDKLGVPRDAVEIEVLDEGNKGLFGLGSRQARVRLTIRGEDDLEFEEESAAEVSPAPRDRTAAPSSQEEDPILETSRQTVIELLSKMKVAADVFVRYGESDELRSQPPVYVDIRGDDLSILIGRKAETLDALQYITRLIVSKEMEQSVSIVVDVEGYRKRRENQIRQLAQRVAEQVRETGRSQALEPMPPNERRFIHIELRDNPDVFTASTDEGHRRKVVIYPKE